MSRSNPDHRPEGADASRDREEAVSPASAAVDAAGELSPADRATASRLSRLRTMPVATAALEHRLLNQLPELAEHVAAKKSQRQASRFASWRGWRALRAVAAVLVLAAAIFLALWSSSGNSALASEMAQVHYDIVSGKSPVMQVDSIDAANKALAHQWAGSPEVPEIPHDHVMACCMRTVGGNKKIACVLMKVDGTPVTLSVANAHDMKVARGAKKFDRAGQTYHVQGAGKLQMVTTQQQGRWICLIGELSPDRLVGVAQQLRFE